MMMKRISFNQLLTLDFYTLFFLDLLITFGLVWISQESKRPKYKTN